MNVTSAEIHPAWLNCVAFLISGVQIDFFFFLFKIEIGKLYFFKHEALDFQLIQASSAE